MRRILTVAALAAASVALESASLAVDPAADRGAKGPVVLQYATGFEAPVELPPEPVRGNSGQYLKGGDIPPFSTPLDLWGTPPIHRAWVLSIVGQKTPLKASAYVENKIRTVTGRNGRPTRVLSLNSKARSPATENQAASFQNANMEREATLYQRMRVKFDADTLARAKALGAEQFFQMFWETKADPDYRIRLQLLYDGETGLYWQAQGDVLTNANALWFGTLKTHPVQLAPHDQAAGWHKVEIWMDRPGGHFRAAIDGLTLVDYSGPLMGASGNRTSHVAVAMLYGASPLGEMLVDDLEIWSAPPDDAWSR